jgi:hypothetical protein
MEMLYEYPPAPVTSKDAAVIVPGKLVGSMTPPVTVLMSAVLRITEPAVPVTAILPKLMSTPVVFVMPIGAIIVAVADEVAVDCEFTMFVKATTARAINNLFLFISI